MLDVGDNVRDDAALSKEFLASIAENGVLVPITGVRHPDNSDVIRVRNGQRRTFPGELLCCLGRCCLVPKSVRRSVGRFGLCPTVSHGEVRGCSNHGEQRVVPASRRGETHPHVFSYPDSVSRGMRARTRRRRPAPPTARSEWRAGARPSSRASDVDREDRGAPHRSYVRRLSTFLPRLRRCSTA